MAISKQSFASTRYRFTSRQLKNYPGDEIPTRSVDTNSARFGRYSYSDVWKSVALSANTQWLDHSRILYSRSKLIPFVRPDRRQEYRSSYVLFHHTHQKYQSKGLD